MPGYRWLLPFAEGAAMMISILCDQKK
jgi:hypothetical protein